MTLEEAKQSLISVCYNKYMNKCVDCDKELTSSKSKRCRSCYIKIAPSIPNKGQFRKGQVPWSKGKKLPFKPRPAAVGRSVWNKGKKLGPNPNHRGENHPAWKGDDVGYKSLHQWIATRIEKPSRCGRCSEHKRLDLANLSQQYRRDISDWEYMCRSCHLYYDREFERNHGKQKRRLHSPK